MKLLEQQGKSNTPQECNVPKTCHFFTLVCLPGLGTHGHRSLVHVILRKYVFVEKSESIMEGRTPALPLGSAPGGCWASLWLHL